MLLASACGSTTQGRRGIAGRYALLAMTLSFLVLLVACGNTATTPVPSTATARVSTPMPSPTSGITVTPTQLPTPAPGLTQVVQITNGSDGSFGFSPRTLVIKTGTTVVWKNVSAAPHTVTSDDGQMFDSGNVMTGGTFQFKFTATGTFPYHCNIHPYMRAEIVVV